MEPTVIIDQNYFNDCGLKNDKLDRIINIYPKCVIVSQRKNYNTNHKLQWYTGKIVLTTEKFELGKWVYFQSVKDSVDLHEINCGFIISEEDVYLSIPQVSGVSDSTNEEFYNLEYFRQKRVDEAEHDLPFKIKWALNRVWYLRKKKFKITNAIKLVSKQSGIDYNTIRTAFNKRMVNLRWGKNDYKNRETD